MKVFLVLLWICSAVFVPAMAQQPVTLSGRVVDEKGEPLPFVNVYLRGTTEGGSTDMDGYFSFPYVAEGEVTLCASMLGYDEFVRTATVARLQGVIIRMRPSSVALDDVVVVGSSYLLKGNSQWNGMSSVDVATETSSNGDLYKAIQMLPGTQASADSGELQVRGGSGRETQTYIDDMHVLFPYTATDENSASRGHYSPFMFEGINFAAGGYASEYADGLSGVLPLYTKDKSEISKCGISPSLIGLSGGGTRAFSNGSLSLNLDYWDLDLYNCLFPDRTEWIDPYRRFSAAASKLTEIRQRHAANPDAAPRSKLTVTMFTDDIRLHVPAVHIEVPANMVFETGCIQHSARTKDPAFRQSGFLHRQRGQNIHRIGNNEQNAVKAVFHQLRQNGAVNGCIALHQIQPALPGLLGRTSGDNHNGAVRKVSIGTCVNFHRACIGQAVADVHGFALRPFMICVKEHHLGK